MPGSRALPRARGGILIDVVEEEGDENWVNAKFGARFRVLIDYGDEMSRTKAGKFQVFACVLPEHQ